MNRARSRLELESQQQAQHVAVQFARRLCPAADPVEQVVVVLVQDRFVAFELGGGEFRQIFARESAQKQVAFLGAAVMALIEQPLALRLHRLVPNIHALQSIPGTIWAKRQRRSSLSWRHDGVWLTSIKNEDTGGFVGGMP